MNIHVLRVVFLKLVSKLACNARLPAYIFCCKELTKNELQKLLIRRQTHCCIDQKLTLKLHLVTLCSSILEKNIFLKYSSKRWWTKCHLHERITYLRRYKWLIKSSACSTLTSAAPAMIQSIFGEKGKV